MRAELRRVAVQRRELVFEQQLANRKAGARSACDLPSSTEPQVMKRSRLLALGGELRRDAPSAHLRRRRAHQK